MSSRHLILNHVDTPIKWLFWTTGELLVYVLPISIGLLIDYLTLGTCVTVFNVWACRQYKRSFGKGQLLAVCYWYLPHAKWVLKRIPPSYIREYLG